MLPRAALASAGTTLWRRRLLRDGSFTDTTLLVNNHQWVFDEVHGYLGQIESGGTS